MQKIYGSEARILELHSEESEDQYSDPIPSIRVDYDAKDNRLVSGKVAAVVGPLPNYIKQLTNFLDRFPTLSFRIIEEAGHAYNHGAFFYATENY